MHWVGEECAGVTDGPDNVFKLGLALSGAISAGAYTAGVLDYFFQALEAWEKERGKDRTPQHRVVVQAITGASAGAITGALGAIALARGMRPQNLTVAEKHGRYVATEGPVQTIRCILPPLYRTWIIRPRMVDPGGGLDLLSAEDIAKPGFSVGSLLNAGLLDDIKKEALMPPSDASRPTVGPPYSYIAEKLHVYMTLSNLRGIPFKVDFGNAAYGMQTHGDRAHYIIKGLGSGQSAGNDWLAGDSSRVLAVNTLPQSGQVIPQEWDRYGTCALASSAFPVGLAPRQISAELKEYTQRSYPAEHGAAAIKPRFPAGWESTLGAEGFVFLNVDGGVVNNNPFDYAQYTIMDDPKHVTTDAKAVDRAVIMVSPFPEPPTFLPEGAPPAELVAVLRALFPTLIDQARFKPAELFPAMSPNDHSRFLIAPDRNINGVEERYAIACGLLGGFGGFLDEKFRAHDFQLGRRNCQAFLRSTLGLPADNKLVAPLNGQEKFSLAGDSTKYAIVPCLGDALPEVPLPEWPRMSQADFDILMKRIKNRLDNIAPRFVQAQTSSRIFRALGRFGLWFGQNRILDYVRFAILSDLVRRDQIAGWDLPPGLPASGDDVRLVLAELANPGFSFRTPEGIAKTIHAAPGTVASILKKLEQAGSGKTFAVWRGHVSGQEVFTLQSRSSSWFTSLPGIQSASNWIDEPAIG
jgi:hypothetical protein